MTIVLITESLLIRSTVCDGRILRDWVLRGFCVRLNTRKRSFLIVASVAGKQFRMMLGYWPLMPVNEAPSHARVVLRQCRKVERPSGKVKTKAPTLRIALGSLQGIAMLLPKPRGPHSGGGPGVWCRFRTF
jgi:hypothetical protein